MKILNKNFKYIFCLVLLIGFNSCTKKVKSKPVEKVESLKILIDKTVEVRDGSALDRGYTRYLLAFSDGHTESTSFGWYTCLQVGDTIRFVKDKGDSDYWLKMKPNCD